VIECPLDPGRAEPDGDRAEVGLGGHGVGGGQLPAGEGGVARLLAADFDAPVVRGGAFLASLAAWGSSFISRAAALRDSWSWRRPGAAAARISSARAASAALRLSV